MSIFYSEPFTCYTQIYVVVVVVVLTEDSAKLATIALLMSSNPDMEVKDVSGCTVLKRAMSKYLDSHAYGTDRSKYLRTFMKHLLNAGATCDQSDLTRLLQSASKVQHFSLMTAVVKRGADLFYRKNLKGILHSCWSRSFYSQGNRFPYTQILRN
jgi:hypothetical protein